jgi:hypothetical protein
MTLRTGEKTLHQIVSTVASSLERPRCSAPSFASCRSQRRPRVLRVPGLGRRRAPRAACRVSTVRAPGGQGRVRARREPRVVGGRARRARVHP